MDILLNSAKIKLPSRIKISGSKSETNRLRLLQVLYPQLQIKNQSDSDDSLIMLQCLKSSSKTKNTHHAGTAMRFLTAYYAAQEGVETVLEGSPRMHQRPIQILVEALRRLGAQIYYIDKEGFPPLLIKGKKLSANNVVIPANISSQYISALLLIAPKLPNGLRLTMQGKITSLPYIQMTLALLNQIGIEVVLDKNTITISPQNTIESQTIFVESDWSSASYFYEFVALSTIGTSICIENFHQKSLQADKAVVYLYEKYFGVKTLFLPKGQIQITKHSCKYPKSIRINLINSPDIAQTIAVTCYALGIEACLLGLHTLRIKETNRLEALKNELEKLGAEVRISANELFLAKRKLDFPLKAPVSIHTYQDHRMAMAFAPLSLLTPLIIQEAEVVSKSFPEFWKHIL